MWADKSWGQDHETSWQGGRVSLHQLAVTKNKEPPGRGMVVVLGS